MTQIIDEAPRGQLNGASLPNMGTSVREDRAANDDASLSLDEAIVLLEEIERLREELAKTEQRLAELDGLAHRDPLVNLSNRRSFLAKLESLIGSVERNGHHASVLFADLDGLKAINDKFGHTAGDQALVEVSRLLVACVRRGDWVARLSGDEFGIVLDHTDELSAWHTALRIVETVDEHPFRVGSVWVPLSIAVGAAAIQPGDTPESVLARADREMYRIKEIRPQPART
jgi:diguanylate cyclase (GGDEF)-like protein